MRALSTIALLTLAATLSAAPVPKELKVRSDGERMQGLWKVDADQSHWLFRGDKLFAGGTPTPDINGYSYGFSMKPEASPPEFEFTGNVNCAGIYKFVGEDLHVAYCAGAVRPTDFNAGPKKYICILKRVSEAKK